MLQNGVVVDVLKKNFGEVQRIVVAAPINISGVPYIMGAMIQRNSNTQRLYLHDVALKKEVSEYQPEHLNTTGSLDTENLFITDILEKAMSVGNSILHNDKRVKENFSDREYSYDELIAKPDMKLTVLSDSVPNNRADIIRRAKKNAAEVGKNNTKDNTISVYVDDIGTDVILGSDGLKHGLRRTKSPMSDANYIVTLKAGEIIKNSIKVNELIPSKKDAQKSYILIGAAKYNSETLYLVRSVINKFSNELTSIDVLYALNAKKEPAALNAPRFTDKPLSVTDSTISIANLLEYVKKILFTDSWEKVNAC